MQLRDALLGVYDGRRDVYGRQRVATTLNEATGQPEREATWAEVTESLTDALVDRHLAGTTTLGMYLLHADSSCGFAVWDIDTDDRAPVMLLLRVLDDAGIDRLVFDSGRKGRHIMVAFEKRIPGGEAYAFARAVWEQAGRPEKVECFPKQAVLTPERPYGNLIKLPLGIHRATGRRCVLLDSGFYPVVEGSETDELAGLQRVDHATIASLAALVAPVTGNADGGAYPRVTGPASVTSSGWVYKPYPCFAELSTTRYREGERDVLLFTLTKHLLNQAQPRGFAELVVERQAERCVSRDGRPAPFAEWAAKVENVYNRGYTSFGCETPAMQQFCKGAACALFGRIHTDATPSNPDPDAPAPPESRVVRLEDLIQLGDVDPEYEVTVNGKRIQGLTVDTLDSWPRFRKAVIGSLRFVPQLPRVKGEDPSTIWHTLVNAALETSTLEDRPSDASSDAEVIQAVCEYLTGSVDVATNRADILAGAVWDQTDDAGVEWRYFTARHVLAALRIRVAGVKQRDLYGILRRYGGSSAVMKITGRAVWLWRAPLETLKQHA